MNCEEFRKQITSGADFTEELLEHHNSCKDCSIWLEMELKTTPKGLNKEAWNKVIEKCLVDEKAQKQTNTGTKINQDIGEEPKEEKSFISCYLSGLKYGLVFGLAIVIGFAIIQNRNESLEKESKEKSKVDAAEILASDSASIEEDVWSKQK